MPLLILPDWDAPDGFPHELKKTARALGLNKDDMRALRKARLSESDETVHKKRVYLSAVGVQKLLGEAEAPPLAEKNAPLDAAQSSRNGGHVKTAVVKLKVFRCDLANKRMLLACPLGLDHNGGLLSSQLMRVRVRSTENFRRGMEIPVTLVDGYKDMFDHYGALPKKPGKYQ